MEAGVSRRRTCYGMGVARRPVFQSFDRSQLRITRVALILLFALVGTSLVFAMLEDDGKARMVELLVPTPDSVWREWKVWTLLTGPFIELRLISLMFQGLMIWMMLPALERWWGPRRFALFVGLTAVAGTIVGTLLGLATGRNVPIVGLDPTLFAAAIAFGILYARQPIQFFGVLPMTGRQFMYGMIALVAIFIVIGQDWEDGAAMAAAMLMAAGITSGRVDPIATWRRWRYARARAHLKVVPSPKGETTGKRKRDKTDERYLN
jgi:membrane associated rhomboid family serine protease